MTVGYHSNDEFLLRSEIIVVSNYLYDVIRLVDCGHSQILERGFLNAELVTEIYNVPGYNSRQEVQSGKLPAAASAELSANCWHGRAAGMEVGCAPLRAIVTPASTRR